MNIEQLYRIFQQHPSIVTDTRLLKKGDLFFALKGPNFNGNQFAARALELAAAYAVVDEPQAAGSKSQTGGGVAEAEGDGADRFILVDDALATLQALALHHRRQFDIPFIAITGSNGKTTTKELIHAVLSSAYTVYTTQGNLNNHIGVPLTLLSIKADAQFAVIEMGANHQGEIAGYCRYALPTHGLISNVGLAHLEGFGGPEGVRLGKGELFDFLRGSDNGGDGATSGTAFVMWDYDYLREMCAGIPHIVSYGTKDADYNGVVAQGKEDRLQAASDKPQAGKQENPFLNVEIIHGAETGIIHTQLVGDYNLPNVLAAVAVGRHFGVSDARIREAIAAYAPSNSRSQLIEKDGNHIILDAYNANPSSMRAAIENFARLAGADAGADTRGGADGADTTAGGKVLILGAMAELGAGSVEEHQRIADLIGKYPWRQVLLVGGDFLKIAHPKDGAWLSFPDAAAAGQWLRSAGIKGAYILIKGSRGMKMETVLADPSTQTPIP
jgi:UDP-N-acetylmuramoyl-tripeptide--D-alanyl-D-alanine ligase